MRRHRRDSDRASSGRPNWADKTNLLIAAAGVAVAIVAIVVGAVSAGGSGGSNPASEAPANLRVIDTVVRDVERGPNQPRAHLEFVLHNVGGRRAVVDRADIEVRRVYELRRCASQDDLPLSNNYGVSLPADAQPGDIVEAPLHQQLGPDEADRFALALSTRVRPREPGSFYVFELDVTLHNDGPRADLPAGTALISLPEIPIVGEYYWGADTAKLIGDLASTSPEYVAELRRFSMPCWRANTVALKKALASPAARSPFLEAVSNELVAPHLAVLE